MKDVNDCTIEELQTRIDELKKIKRDKALEDAKSVVGEINTLIKYVNDLGFGIDTYDSIGCRLLINEIVYQEEYDVFSVKDDE